MSEPALTVTWSVAFDIDGSSALIDKAGNGPDAKGIRAFGGCSFIAMSTHGHEGLHRRIMGSVTGHVLRASKLPMLIVQPEKEQTHLPEEEII